MSSPSIPTELACACEQTPSPSRISRTRLSLSLIALVVVSGGSLTLIDEPRLACGTAIALSYLVLALTEVVPPFVPTLFLLVATPLSLAQSGDEFALGAVMRWAADPVLLLFAGGLSLGTAAQRHEIDAALANIVVRLARGNSRRLLALTMVGTAVMSMWMSNIAAAAMMFAVLRPLLRRRTTTTDFRRGLLLGVAIAANIGGISTPVGSGPNALAISAVASRYSITFLHWMSFALPLVVGLLVAAYLMLTWRYRVNGGFPALPTKVEASRKARAVVVVFSLAVLAWLTEPVHGVSAPLVAAAVTFALFASRLLERRELGEIDWSTLGLIAGGIMLGKLLERAGVLAMMAEFDWTQLPRLAWLALLVVASAALSAVMSNTGTAALLIPLALSIDPAPHIAVLIAVSASFGMPFSISTPQNAMAYGEGGLRSVDLLWIGLAIMVLGCVIVTFTGEFTLRLLGVP